MYKRRGRTLSLITRGAGAGADSGGGFLHCSDSWLRDRREGEKTQEQLTPSILHVKWKQHLPFYPTGSFHPHTASASLLRTCRQPSCVCLHQMSLLLNPVLLRSFSEGIYMWNQEKCATIKHHTIKIKVSYALCDTHMVKAMFPESIIPLVYL